MKRLLIAGLLLGISILLAETPVPATVEFAFESTATNDGIKISTTGDARYFMSARRSGGNIANGWWRVTSDRPFGDGTLQFNIDRAELPGDLALVLRVDWQKDTDLAVQLFDGQGRAIALDLFGEMAHNARAVGTDTFVVPLNRYPEATTISVRRLAGDLRVLGGGLYPVLSEVTANAENENALAQQLGVLLSPHHWMFTRGGGTATGSPEGTTTVGDVHVILPLDRTNQVAAAALKQGGYPPYRPLSNTGLGPVKFSISNTTEAILTNALRMIALASGGEPAKPFYTSSDGVAHQMLKAHESVGFMSVALSSAEKEEFFRASGHRITEVQFARDALQILVNDSNSIGALTIPQLDAIYGAELRAGAPELIRDWNQLGGAGGKIKAVGGHLNYGTTRTFQQLVLNGGAFRDDLVKSDVVYSRGVEKQVARDTAAIGFATLRRRGPVVRLVPIAPNSGETAYLPDAPSVYSGKYPLQRKFYGYIAARSFGEAGPFERELVNLLLSDVGQTLVARAGSLPLMASEVVAERSKLDLR